MHRQQLQQHDGGADGATPPPTAADTAGTPIHPLPPLLQPRLSHAPGSSALLGFGAAGSVQLSPGSMSSVVVGSGAMTTTATNTTTSGGVSHREDSLGSRLSSAAAVRLQLPADPSEGLADGGLPTGGRGGGARQHHNLSPRPALGVIGEGGEGGAARLPGPVRDAAAALSPMLLADAAAVAAHQRRQVGIAKASWDCFALLLFPGPLLDSLLLFSWHVALP